VASGAGSQAFGWRANATGAQSVAVGNQAQATGANATALGNGSIANADNATALGQGAQATAANATALGKGATAGFAGSTAIGAGAATTAANQVSIGGAGSSVRVGDIAASTASQQASSTTLATVDANGVLGRSSLSIGSIQNSFASFQGQLNSLFDLDRRQDKRIDKADEGVAMALALESPSVPAGATFAFSGGIGGYEGKHALATAISAAVGEMSTISAGVGYGLNSGEIGYRGGFQIAF
jgi:autotransporter adhesin